LNSALKVILGTDIFPRVPKKKLNFVVQCRPIMQDNTDQPLVKTVTSEATSLSHM
jgi:hypothetical protein